MNRYALLIRNRAATTVLLVCSLVAVGCGSSRLTDDQARVFTNLVAPELERVLRALDDTNATPVGVGRPLRLDHPVCSQASIDGSLWLVHRDGCACTLELKPPNAVTVLSMVADDSRIHQAVSKLQERLASGDIEGQLRFWKKIEDATVQLAAPTNEFLLAIQQIRRVAQVLKFRPEQGAVAPGIKFELRLHHARKASNGTYLPEEGSGGYVGLYSANTNLDSVDLVVFVYRGKVQAILKRSEALARKPRSSPAPGTP